MAGHEKDRVHQLYLVSIVGKGALAILECISGLALTFASTQTIVTLVGKVTQGEIAEDPRDLIASHLMTWAAGFSADNKAFYAWYFLSHGIVKLLIVAALLSGRLWAFPLSIAALGLAASTQSTGVVSGVDLTAAQPSLIVGTKSIRLSDITSVRSSQ